MKKRNLILRAAVVAAFAISSSAAFAAVNLSASPVVPVKFASELLTANVALTNPSGALDLNGAIGWGVAANNHLYIRIDLANGKFIAAPTLTLPAAITPLIALSAGGGVASTFAIFDVTDTAAALTLTSTFTLAPTAAGLTLIDPLQPITATVKYYTDSTLAATNGTALATLSGSYTTSGAALTTTFTPAANTALVSTDFKGFAAGTAPSTAVAGATAMLGQIVTVVNTATVMAPATGVGVLPAALATANNLVLTGDFSAVGTTGAIFVDTATACTTAPAATATPAGAGSSFVLNTAKTTATATGYATASLTNLAINICYKADGTTAIPTQTVTAVQTYTGQVASAVVPAALGTVGTIVRNGTTLVAPLVNIPAGWVSRFVLNNLGTIDRAYTVTALGETGNVITLTGAAAGGTLKSGTTVIDLATLMSASGAPRSGLKVVVAASPSDIDGLYQIVNLTTGSVSNYVLSPK